MNPIETKFYRKFWSDNACKSIFLLHKSSLLKKRTLDLEFIKQDYFSSEIIISNTLSNKQLINKIERRIESDAIDVEFNLVNSIKKYFDEETLLKYIRKKYGRTLNKVSKKIEKKGVIKFIFSIIEALQSEQELLKFSRKYHLTPKEIKSIGEFEQYFLDEIKIEARKYFQKESISEMIFSFDGISKIYDSRLKDLIIESDKHYINVLYENEEYKDRRELFEELYELKIIKPGQGKSFYECINCPPNTFTGLINTNISPSKLNLKCPACNDETFFAVPYELCKEIYSHVKHKDGILFHALHYLINNLSIPHKLNLTLLKDVEIDICLLNKNEIITEIIEVKMFKSDRPKDTLIGNLKQVFHQIKKMRSKLITSDKTFDKKKYSIITNIECNDIISEACGQLSSEMKEFNVKIYSPHNYKKYLEQNGVGT